MAKAKNQSLPSWIWYWALIASLLVICDCAYVIGITFNFTKYLPTTILELWTWYGESDSQYSAQGMNESNGWIITQSLFNVIEVVAQLAFLFLLRKGSLASVLTILLTSMATLWKTLIYMSIIAFSSDPVRMVPALACLGFSPLPVNEKEVLAALEKDNCSMQYFKFQFNFWWIILPTMVIYACCAYISNKFDQLERLEHKKVVD